MAFDQEDMARRRKRRKEQQERHRRARRKMLLALIAAAVVLVLVIVLIIALAGRGKNENSDKKESQQGEEIISQEGKTVIHIAAGGDLNVTDQVVAAGGLGQDYAPVFQDIIPALSQADLTVVNLEGNTSGMPYGTETRSAPDSLLKALRNAGVDMIQLGNSKTLSNGLIGLQSTLRAVRTAGMEPVGAFVNAAEQEQTRGFTLVDVQGVKVALVSFTKGFDKMSGIPRDAQNCVNLLYTDPGDYQKVNTAGITEVLRAVSLEKPDVTIALLHWGSEYNDIHSDTQETIRKLMVKEGVDAIIGTHPHYVQEMIYDKEAGTFTAFSLGDFLPSEDKDGKKYAKDGTKYSVILDLEITKDHKTGKTKITGFSYTPIFAVEENNTIRLMRLEPAMQSYREGHIRRVNANTYAKMEYALERIRARINKE